MNQYDFPALLNLDGMRETNVTRIRLSPFYPDGTAEIRYDDLPYGALAGASEWLYQNRAVMTDAVIGGHIELSGLWRTVGIEERPKTRGNAKDGVFLVQVLAKGYYTKLDWNVMRIAQGSNAKGDTTQPPGVATGKSALYRRTVSLRMPFVDAGVVEALAASITSSSWTDLVVAQNTKLAGVWFNMGASYRLEEDNTASLYIMLGQPVFTIKSYQNHDTWELVERYYVSNVPAHLVAQVSEEWKTLDGTGTGTPRKGASASTDGFNPQSNTANVILSVPVPSAKEAITTQETENAYRHVLTQGDVNMSAAHALPALVVGKQFSVDNQETTQGKFNRRKSEDTAKEALTAEHVVQVRADGVTIKSTSARHIDPASIPSWAAAPSATPAGTGVSVQRNLNEYGGLSVQRTEQVATPVRRPATGELYFPIIATTTSPLTAYIVEHDNVLPASLQGLVDTFNTEIAAKDGFHSVSVQPRFNSETGTFSVRLTATPLRTNPYNSGEFQLEETWLGYEIRHKMAADPEPYSEKQIVVMRKEQYRYGVKQNNQMALILAFLEDEDNTNVTPLGRWGYRATYRTLVWIGDWSTEEDEVPDGKPEEP